jgi:hypothetical protein
VRFKKKDGFFLDQRVSPTQSHKFEFSWLVSRFVFYLCPISQVKIDGGISWSVISFASLSLKELGSPATILEAPRGNRGGYTIYLPF